MLGLCGSHRTGKTTLAKRYAEKNGLEFVETSASAVFKEMGLDPAKTYDFATRLTVQEAILTAFDKVYAKHVSKLTITDRTPLDLMAYTLAEATGEAVRSEDQARLSAYIEKCFDVVNKRFLALIVIQPGIQLVQAEGKGAMNSAFIEHLNSLVLGLSVDERVKTAHFYLPRHMVDLEERVSAVDFAFGRARKRAEDEYRVDNTMRH